MLTDAKVRAAQPRDRGYKLFDSHRLYLFVTPTGARAWRMNYVYDGKNLTMPFGPYPLVSLAEARALRDDARRLLAQGTDPLTAKRLKIEANVEASRHTFELVAREWHALCEPQWAKVHAADVLRSLDRDVFPRIGMLPIASITAPKVLEVLRAIEERSAIETAKRVRQRLSAVFAYAISSGMSGARAHLRYVERNGTTRDGQRGQLYGAEADRIDGKVFLDEAEDDRHQFRFIVSPEDGAEYDDLKPLTRRLMARMEEDLGTSLDWVAVDHFNTGHPHTHPRRAIEEARTSRARHADRADALAARARSRRYAQADG